MRIKAKDPALIALTGEFLKVYLPSVRSGDGGTIDSYRHSIQGYAGWTLRLLAEYCMENQYLVSVSHTAIGDMLNTNELKPHLSRYWCIPKLNDAAFVANMEDVLTIYEMPYTPENTCDMHGRKASPITRRDPGTDTGKTTPYRSRYPASSAGVLRKD